MKTKSILFLSALTLFLGVSTTSCDKDDDEYQLPAATLTGKWFYSKVGTVVAGAEVLTDYTDNEPGCSKDYVDFGANNEYVDANFDSTDSPCELSAATGTYAVTGNTIVVDLGDETITGTLLNLSYTELKIKDNDSGTIVVFNRS